MNIDGTYVSEDGDFELIIQNSNESNSTFGGTYVSIHTPQGKQSFSVTGRWYYVNNPGGSLVPLSIGFTAIDRPSGREYATLDAWAGEMVSQTSIKMNGVRSYLPAGGSADITDLGTHIFDKR